MSDKNLCEHDNCDNIATWNVNSHSFGAVVFNHYYCSEHFNLHISGYKLEPKKDIWRLRMESSVKEPTQEQQQEFWEKVGFKYKEGWELPWVNPQNKNNQHGNLPQITLNNIFRYAVPKATARIMVSYGVDEYEALAILFRVWLEKFSAGVSYSVSLFWTIHEVLEGKDAD